VSEEDRKRSKIKHLCEILHRPLISSITFNNPVLHIKTETKLTLYVIFSLLTFEMSLAFSVFKIMPNPARKGDN